MVDLQEPGSRGTVYITHDALPLQPDPCCVGGGSTAGDMMCNTLSDNSTATGHHSDHSATGSQVLTNKSY